MRQHEKGICPPSSDPVPQRLKGVEHVHNTPVENCQKGVSYSDGQTDVFSALS